MKKYLFLLACMLNTVLASAQYSGSGSGTEDDPYLIYNETQLYQMSNFIGDDHAGVVFKLMKDIDLTDFISENFPNEGWTPIGVESSHFKGKFYGNNHTISGLSIHKSIDYVGFFGYVDGATVIDLTLKGTSIVGIFHTGTLCGHASSSTISNCTVELSSTIMGNNFTGGFAGDASGTIISDCSFIGTSVTGLKESACFVGSVYFCTISNCSSYADGLFPYPKYSIKCGGFTGCAMSSTFTECSTLGNISGGSCLGGFSGWIESTTINNCTATGNVTGDENVGGFIGKIAAIDEPVEMCFLSSCKSVGNIDGIENVSGFAGSLYKGSSVTFTDCHSKGTITNTGDCTGGIVGISNGACIAGMENCSHFGDINGQNYVGGLVGQMVKIDSGAPTLHRYTLSASTYSECDSYISSTTHGIVAAYRTVTESISNGAMTTNTIKNCTAIGNISGKTYIGGLIGEDLPSYSYSGTANTLNNSDSGCHWYLWKDGSYTGTSSYNLTATYYTYTLCYSSLSITDSYYSGSIAGTEYVGGIAGHKVTGNVNNCYSYSSGITGTKNVGGIAGYIEGETTSSYVTLKSNVAINTTISATESNIGRIYGSAATSYVTIGALASSEGNKALTTTRVIKQGVVQDITDDLQNGNVMGKSLLKLKANYVALGWDFDNNWDILETECFPYKKYQAAPPVIGSELVSHDTEISGSSLNGGTVYLYYKDNDAVSTTCSGNAWKFTTEALQSGAAVQLYADVDGMTPSYLTSATVGFPGSGTEADPYRIYTAEDLQGASNKGYYKLMNDIDLTDWINENSPTEGWVSIGRNSGEATYINGDGHKITGLWTNTTQDYTGLFSNFSAGIIKNLTVEVASGKKVKGGDYTGVLIGRNANGQLLNCTINGDAEGTNHVGGVTGYSANNTVNAMTYEGTVTSTANNAYVGGFAGLSENDAITAVHITPTISATGSDNYVGGLVGYMNGGAITKSQAENTLTATGANDYVGGLVGYSKGDITLSYSTGTVTASGDNSYTGGLVGYAYNPITNCYTTAKTTGTYYTAGICAYTFSIIDKCYANGDVYGSRYGGGVVAQLDGSASALTNSIAANNKLELTDQSSWGSRVIGGFKNGCSEPVLGSNLALSTMQVSLNGVPQKKTDDNVEGVATSEEDLMKSSTYTSLGWDFNKIWTIAEGEGYPTFVVVSKYTLTYKVDGKVYTTESYEEGAEITPIPEPIKEGYTFSGWSEIPSVMPANDVTVVGTFKENPIPSEDTDLTQYDNVIYIEGAEATTGSQKTLSLKMNNKVAMTGFQCDVYMPDGVSIAKDEDDFYLIALSTSRTTEKKTNTFDSAIQADGSVRVLCGSTKSYTFDGTEGEVATITIDVDKTVSDGEYPLILKNIVMSDATGKTYKISYVKTTLKVSSYTLGDPNNDKSIDIGDYTTIANHILGNDGEVFIEKAADVNLDNEINVGDLTAEANLILYGGASSAKALRTKALASTDPTTYDNIVYINDGSLKSGETADLSVQMKNSVAMTGFQFDFVKPEGISIDMEDDFYNINLSTERTTAKKTNTFDSALQTDGSVRVLCGSTKSYTFSGNEGEVATITVKADDNLANGNYTVTLKNIVMSDATGKTYKVSQSDATITISNATGIGTLNAESSLKDGKYMLDKHIVIVKDGKRYNVFGEMIK